MSDKNLFPNTEPKLKEVLLEIPQFQKKDDLLPMYVAYEFPSEQSYLLHFWQHAIKHVMKKYFGQVSVQISKIRECFCFNHFEPACFFQVLKELMKTNSFILLEDLDAPETYKELGLNYPKEIPKQSILLTLSGMLNPLRYEYSYMSKVETNRFFQKEETMIAPTSRLIDMITLKENIKSAIHRFNEIFKDKTIASEDELDAFFIDKMGFTKLDLNLYKEIFLNSGVLTKEVAEIGRKRYHLFIYNPNNTDVSIDKMNFILQSAIYYFDKKIEDLEVQAMSFRQEAAKAVKKKNKEQAKYYLKLQKMRENAMKVYADKKIICEENLLNLETSSWTEHMVHILQSVKTTHNELKINPDELFDIAQSMKEISEERKETGAILEKMVNENSQDVEDEYSMLEKQILAESGPLAEKKSLPLVQIQDKAPQQVQKDEKLVVENEGDEDSMNIEQFLTN